MDRMKEGDAREVIRWEAEQHVPFDMANVELDFQILDPDAEGLQMNVLLVAAKRELVENRVGLLGEAGLAPAIIDVDAFAIHNAFELNHPDAMQGVVGLVNIGHEVTNVNILEDAVPSARTCSARKGSRPRTRRRWCKGSRRAPISRATSRRGERRSRWGWSALRPSSRRRRGGPGV